MSKISNNKIEKIKNEILFILFENNLKGMYTKDVSDEIARDKEFVLKILKELESKNLVKNVLKHKVRKKWIMTEKAYEAYKQLY